MSEAPPTPKLPVQKHSPLFWLRIAASVFFGLLTVALCMLWVLSYGTWRCTQGPVGNHVLCFQWTNGELGIGYWDWKFMPFPWSLRSNTENQQFWESATGGFPLSKLGIRWYRQPAPALTLVVFPFWLPVLTTTAIASIPWVRNIRRFSLRTLLIATTLVAVVLGLAVWVSK